MKFWMISLYSFFFEFRFVESKNTPESGIDQILAVLGALSAI